MKRYSGEHRYYILPDSLQVSYGLWRCREIDLKSLPLEAVLDWIFLMRLHITPSQSVYIERSGSFFRAYSICCVDIAMEPFLGGYLIEHHNARCVGRTTRLH